MWKLYSISLWEYDGGSESWVEILCWINIPMVWNYNIYIDLWVSVFFRLSLSYRRTCRGLGYIFGLCHRSSQRLIWLFSLNFCVVQFTQMSKWIVQWRIPNIQMTFSNFLPSFILNSILTGCRSGSSSLSLILPKQKVTGSTPGVDTSICSWWVRFRS